MVIEVKTRPYKPHDQVLSKLTPFAVCTLMSLIMLHAGEVDVNMFGDPVILSGLGNREINKRLR